MVASEGYEAGYKDGLHAATETLQSRLQVVEALINALEKPTSALNDTVAIELARLAVSIAESVLQKEIETSPEHFGQFIHDALALMPASSEPPAVKAHPQDIETLRALSINGLDNIEWQSDPQQPKGHLAVTRHHSGVDTGIEPLLRNAIQQLDLTRRDG